MLEAQWQRTAYTEQRFIIDTGQSLKLFPGVQLAAGGHEISAMRLPATFFRRLRETRSSPFHICTINIESLPLFSVTLSLSHFCLLVPRLARFS